MLVHCWVRGRLMTAHPNSPHASCSIPLGWLVVASQPLPLHDPAMVSTPAEPQPQLTERVAAKSPASVGRAPLAQRWWEMEASPLLRAVGTGHQHHAPSLVGTEVANVRDHGPPGELLWEPLPEHGSWGKTAPLSSSLVGARFEFYPTSDPHLIIIKPYLLQQQGSLGGWLHSGWGGGEST